MKKYRITEGKIKKGDYVINIDDKNAKHDC